MRQNQPVFGQVFNKKPVAKLLNLGEKDIDARFPIQEVSTGLPFIIVPLKKLAAVKAARPDRKLLLDFVRPCAAKDMLIFCPETYQRQNDLNVRVFAEYDGVPEDPATGSANGCLAGYLLKHDYFGRDKLDLRVEQGMEIGRPSLLRLKADKDGRGIAVSVGGKVIMVAKCVLARP